jgi:hypothetical protein
LKHQHRTGLQWTRQELLASLDEIGRNLRLLQLKHQALLREREHLRRHLSALEVDLLEVGLEEARG